MSFKKDFVWGAATASYQIEGAAFEDGKGLSVWDICSHQPGFVKHGNTGDIACDHYHRYKEDVAIMKKIGLKAYRLSISWPRVIPDGVGDINEKGLQFYDNLIDELLANGIEPYITMFHWDYPNELYKKGGWLNPDSSDWFAEYAKVLVERYSDRVKYWMTINEPQCFIGVGHKDGVHAPGVKLGDSYLLQASHNTLLAHGKAVQVIRKYGKQPCEVGFAPASVVNSPETNSEKDIEAARKATFECTKENYVWANSFWMDPIFLGKYPEELKELEEFMPEIGPDDMKIIQQPLDFFGVNNYHGGIVRHSKEKGFEWVKRADGYARTAIDWPVTPESLYWGPKFFYERYKSPILITENGMSNIDCVCLDGQVHDPVRIDFLTRYLSALKQAAKDGVDVKGYFQWSLMDNFEWSLGYNERFGLIYVDYPTGNRILKDSAYWYSGIIKNNGDKL